MKPDAAELLERRIDRLDRDASEIETHLFGNGGALLSSLRRRELRAELATTYRDMAAAVEQLATAIRKRTEDGNG